MLQVSQFWRDRLAGVLLGPRWAKKDAQIALAGEVELTIDEAEALSLSTWAALPMPRRQALEQDVYGGAGVGGAIPIVHVSGAVPTDSDVG